MPNRCIRPPRSFTLRWRRVRGVMKSPRQSTDGPQIVSRNGTPGNSDIRNGTRTLCPTLPL
jgi:hypothetical protein